jgi:hypothetical protein
MLGATLVASGALKTVGRTQFRDSLSSTELLPSWVAVVLAWLAPPIEMVLGVMLLASWRLDWAAPATCLLTAAFVTFLAAYRLAGGKELACGCFGDFEEKGPVWRLILRGCLLFSASVFLLSTHETRLQPADALAAGMAAIGLVIAWTVLSRLADTLAWLREGEN